MFYNRIHVMGASLQPQTSLRAKDGIATRISIVVGSLDRLGATDLSDALGLAFTASGQGLDHMRQQQRLPISKGLQDPFRRPS